MAQTVEEVISALTRIEGHIGEWSGEALLKVGQEILEVAKERTPVVTGALRDSGQVELVPGDNPEVNIVFGGEDTAYAIYVHENLKAKHTPPGRSKFLESAVQDHVSVIRGEIEHELFSLFEKA